MNPKTLLLLLLPLLTHASPPRPPPHSTSNPTPYLIPSSTFSSPPPPPTPQCINAGISLTAPPAAKALIALLRTQQPFGGCTLSNGQNERELKRAKAQVKGQMKLQDSKAVLGVVDSMGWEGDGVGVRCEAAADYLQRILDGCTGTGSAKVAGFIEFEDKEVFCKEKSENGERKEWHYGSCHAKLTVKLIA